MEGYDLRLTSSPNIDVLERVIVLSQTNDL